MIKLFLTLIAFLFISPAIVPEVKVVGAVKNIMIKGDLTAYANLDTISKKSLYALGPIEGLKGETIILNGEVYSSQKNDKKIVNQQNKISKTAMLVYSYVENWTAIKVNAKVNNYAELETLISQTAKKNSYDSTIPFAFKIKAKPKSVNYHIIDWKKGVVHTTENHKQFAYSTKSENSNITFLGFYSDHHHGIFTHHTTNMHIHILDEKTKNVGHLDNLQINSELTIYLPQLNNITNEK